MVIELVEGDESRVRWNYGDGWHYADIDDLIRAYESIRHGHWINSFARPLKCSSCGIVSKANEITLRKDFKFCPYCGAKMDEVKDAETD